MQQQQIDRPQNRIPRRNHQEDDLTVMPKSQCIIVYTVVVCLSCLYLETQHFQHKLADQRAHYMAILTYFDVFMCLWSYYQTIKIHNNPPKLAKIDSEGQQSQKFFDYSYSPTHNYCTVCKNYKFPRVHHCSTCGKCQYKMDHHCIWTQTCIGYRNLKPFFLFCFYMTIGVFQFWYFTYRVIHQKTGPFLILFEPGVMILWFFTMFSAFFVGIMIVALIVVHIVMLMTNYRTLDGMKTKRMCPLPFFQKGNPPDYLNLFDRGQLQNFKQFFGREWWLWLIPIAKQPQNDIFPEPMAPHPDPYSLKTKTNLYQVDEQYMREMKKLPKLNFLQMFLGKKMKINGQIFLLSDSSAATK